MNSLPLVLSELRKQKGLSFRQLSKMVGISHNNLRLYEHGEVVPSLENAARIATFYAVPVDYLVLGEELVTEFRDTELRALMAKADQMGEPERRLVKELVTKVISNWQERRDLEERVEKL